MHSQSPVASGDRARLVPTTRPSESAQGAAPEIIDAPAPGTAEAVAKRAATYAQNVEPMVQKRSAKRRADSTEWPDPDALGMTAQHPAPSELAQTSGAKSTGRSETQPAGPNTSVTATPQKKPIGPEAEQATVEGTIVPAPPSETLARKFAQRAKDYPQDLSAQLDDQLMRFLHDEPVPDVQSIAGLSAEDRELISAIMDSLTNFRGGLRADNNMLFSKKIRPLIELGDRVRGQAELSVPTIALCNSVHGFGLYEPIEPARFVSGQERKVVVYCEVENFLSQLNEKKQYETRLTQDVVLYTESTGLEVWKDKKLTYVDLARTRRHDFFIGRVITLPANLTLGTYLLKVTIEDTQARHIAENTVAIEVVAK